MVGARVSIVKKPLVTLIAEYEYNHQLLHCRASTPFPITTLVEALPLPFLGDRLVPTFPLDETKLMVCDLLSN